MKIKDYRIAAGLTQQQFADLFGISIDTVKAWDCGRRKPDRIKEKLIIEKLEQLNKEGKMDNRYYNFTDAVKAAEKIIGNSLLEDNSGTKWDCCQ